jgi:hypothetical protein
MGGSIWKLSMGRGASGREFSSLEDVNRWINQGLVLVWRPTGPVGGSQQTQGEQFQGAPNRDLFSLCHGNDELGILLLGELTGDASPIVVAGGRDGWYARPFRLIRNVQFTKRYSGVHRVWSPRGVSTFVRVPEKEYAEFESAILEPYFEMSMDTLLGRGADG